MMVVGCGWSVVVAAVEAEEVAAVRTQCVRLDALALSAVACMSE